MNGWWSEAGLGESEHRLVTAGSARGKDEKKDLEGKRFRLTLEIFSKLENLPLTEAGKYVPSLSTFKLSLQREDQNFSSPQLEFSKQTEEKSGAGSKNQELM